ncbi:unnamed protein product, partial [Staurois parvus]
QHRDLYFLQFPNVVFVNCNLSQVRAHQKAIGPNSTQEQWWTDNSWGPRAIGDRGARVLAQTQKSL